MTERTKEQQEIITRVLNNCDKRFLNEIISKVEAGLNYLFERKLDLIMEDRIPIPKNPYYRHLKYEFTPRQHEETKILYDVELNVRSGRFYIRLRMGVIDAECRKDGLDMFKAETTSFETDCELVCSFYTLTREIKRQYKRDRKAFDNMFKLFAPNHHKSIKAAMLQLANDSA